MKTALLIFAKNLIPGQVKTRFAATAGNDVALTVYKALLAHTASITNYLPVEKYVFYSNFIERHDVWEDKIFNKQIQTGDELGKRIQNAFSQVFNKGYDKVVIIGTDCLELSPYIIMNAFAYLNNHDVVIGPAKDGGYYLLGMKKNTPELFKNVSWSTNKVLQQTLTICNSLHLSTHLLPELSDIDNEMDWIKHKEKFLNEEV